MQQWQETLERRGAERRCAQVGGTLTESGPATPATILSPALHATTKNLISGAR